MSALGNVLHLVWKGAATDTGIWWSTTSFADWTSWTSANWVTPAPIGQAGFEPDLAPCLTDADGSTLAMVWRNPADQSLS